MARLPYFVLISIFLFSCGTSEFPKGQKYYKLKCANCHMDDGSGLGTYIPSLKNNKLDYLDQICVVYSGRAVKNLAMPAFKELSPVEYTNLINYLNDAFGNKKSYLPKDIDLKIKECQ